MVSGWWGKGAPSTIKSVYPFVVSVLSGVANALDDQKTDYVDVPAGSYVVNLNASKLTTSGQLMPYGLVYDLIVNAQVPVYWVVDPSDSQSSDVDAIIDGKNYISGAFVIHEENASEALPVLNSWRTAGVVVDGPTLSSTSGVPVYDVMTSFPLVVLDKQNGSIAQKFLEDALIPASQFAFKPPAQLNACDDVYVMPHADPTWEEHSNLIGFNQSGGGIWGGCHAPSVLEVIDDPLDSDLEPDMNFLTTGGLVNFKEHGDGTPPYVHSGWASPVMQFHGQITDATLNGSEQIYLPLNGSTWNPGAEILVVDNDHPEVGAGQVSLGEAAVLVFGRGFDSPTNGYVMYEGGHDIGGNGPDELSAQRAFFNFLLLNGVERGVEVSVQIPDTDPGAPGIQLESGANYLLSAAGTGGSGNFTYQWSDSCGGIYDDPTLANPTLSLDPRDEDLVCQIKVAITDTCGRTSFQTTAVVIEAAAAPLPIPVSPNPDYTAACATDVAIVLDGSSSIDTSGLEQGVRAAYDAFLDQLILNKDLTHPQADVKVSVVEFGTNAQAPIVSLSLTPSTYSNEFSNYINNQYNPPSSSSDNAQGTNYEAAFDEVNSLPSTFDYVVFMSDGVPTFWYDDQGRLRGSGTNGGGRDTLTGEYVSGQQNVYNSLEQGAGAANTFKEAGGHIYFVGINDTGAFTGSAFEVIKTMTDGNASNEYSPQFNNVGSADYIVGNVDSLAQKLRELVEQACPPTVVISGRVYNDQNRNAVNDGALEDWGNDVAYVALLDSQNVVLAWQDAGLDGLYEFVGYSSGAYKVVTSRVQPVIGQVIAAPTPPEGWAASAPVPGEIQVNVVDGVYQYLDNDFGLYQPPPTSYACYAIADSADFATEFNFVDGSEVIIGNNSALPVLIEGGDIDPANSARYYVANQTGFGYVNLYTGGYTSLSATYGDLNSQKNGLYTPGNVTGLAFDSSNGYLYAVAIGSDSKLFRVNKFTGKPVENAFGSGESYVNLGIAGVEAVAVDPASGQMYVATNTQLFEVDKHVGTATLVGGFGVVSDMEGLAFTPDGKLFGSTGNGGSDPALRNSVWDINITNGLASNSRPLITYSDYETVSCVTQLLGQPTAELSVSKSDGTNEVFVGSPLQYEISVVNSGPDAAYGVKVVDVLPAGLVGASWSCVANEAASCLQGQSGQDGIDSLVDLSPGGEVRFIIDATIAKGFVGELANTVDIFGPAGLVDSVDNNQSVDITNVVPAPISGIKEVGLKVDLNDDGNVDSGDTLVFAVRYQNPSAGSVDVNDFSVTDVLPAELVYQSGTLRLNTEPVDCAVGAAVNVNYDGTEINSSLLDAPVVLREGCSLAFVFEVQVATGVPDNATISNVAFGVGDKTTVDGAKAGPAVVVTNSVQTTDNNPDLVVYKAHSPEEFILGGVGNTYQLIVSNVSSVATSGEVLINDTLPEGMALLEPPSGAGWDCSLSTGVEVVWVIPRNNGQLS